MPRKTWCSFVLLLGFVRFQGLRSCNAYILWSRGPWCRLQSQTGQRVSGEWHRGVAGDSSPFASIETTLCRIACAITGASRSPGQSFAESHMRVIASTSAFCKHVCWIVRRRTLPATWLPKIWAKMSFFLPPMAEFLGQREGVFVESACVPC